MAAIDKTYVHDYDTWKELYDYAGEAAPFGKKGLLRNFCYGPYTKEDFEDNYGRCLWNTPTYIDLWLAENCKHEVVVDTLKYQYGDEDYEEMASGEYRRKQNEEMKRYTDKRNEGCYPTGEVYFSISKKMNSHSRMSHGSFCVEITEDVTGEKWIVNESTLIPGPSATSTTGYNYFSYNQWANSYIEAFRWSKHTYHYKAHSIVYNKFYPHQFNKHFIYKLLKNFNLKPGLTIKIIFEGWCYKYPCKANNYRNPADYIWRDEMIVHTKNRRVRKHKCAK